MKDPDRPALWRAALRFVLLLVLLAAGFFILRFTPLAEYLEREQLTRSLEGLRQAWWSPLALLGFYGLLCPVGLPASPLVFAGGFVFGIWTGSLYNFLGTFLGAAISYGLGRVLGRDFVVQLLGETLRPVERKLSRLGFWALARIRFLPIPFPVVNYGAALTGIRPTIFLGSSALGLAPAILIYTWFAAALAEAAEGERGWLFIQLGAALLGVLLLTFIPVWWEGRKRKRRYDALRAERRGRAETENAQKASESP